MQDPNSCLSNPTVAFVDIGNSKTTLTIAKYTTAADTGKSFKAEILYCKSERNLGGRDFDWQIMEHLSKEKNIEHNNKVNLIKLLRAAAKAKKELTTSDYYCVEFDDFNLDDEDEED